MNVGKIIKRFVVPLVILGAAGGGVFAMKLLEPEVEQKKPEEKKWVIQTTVIQPGEYRPEEDLIGVVRSSKNKILHSQVNSEIVEIHRQSGALVEAGEMIMSLDSDDHENHFQSAEADLLDIEASIAIAKNTHQLNTKTLAIEKKQLVLAKRELNHQKELRKRKLISQAKADQAQADFYARELRVAQSEIEVLNFEHRLQKLEAQHSKSQLALEKTKEQLDNTTLKAPFAGRLARVPGKVGQLVNTGAELAYLYDPTQLEVHVQLPIALANALVSNAVQMEQVTGTVNVDGRKWPVRLTSMSGSVEKGYASQQGIFTIEPGQNGVIPGQSVMLKVQLAPVDNSFLVPQLALFEDGRVYRKNEDNRLESIDVNVVGSKQTDQTLYLVTSDLLKADDQLMTTRLSNAITGLLTTSMEEAAEEKARKIAEKEKEKDGDDNGDEDNSDDNGEEGETENA